MSATRTGSLVLAHVAGLLAVDAAYLLFLEHAPAWTGLDDPVGAGLVGFMVLALAAAATGLVGGWFLDHGRLAVVWGIAAPLAAIAMVLATNLTYGGLDLDVLTSDLLVLVPMLTGLLVVPALVAGIATCSLSTRRRGRAHRSAAAPG